MGAGFRQASLEALATLIARVERLEPAGRLGGRNVHDAVLGFHALCEGLAALELRGLIARGEESIVLAGRAHRARAGLRSLRARTLRQDSRL